jgi:hypothetical protein
VSAATLPPSSNPPVRVRARRTRLLWLTACLSAAAVLAASAAAAEAPAAGVLTVTNTSDSGAGSLRQAIADAATGDTINFSLPASSTITLTSQEIVLDKNLSIEGPGAAALTVSGNRQGRVLRVASGVTASVSGLTLRDGLFLASARPGNDAESDAFGGGILNAGTLSLSDCVVTNNAALGSSTPVGSGNGGGIDNSGALTLINCTVSNNLAAGGGGFLDANRANGGGINNRAGATLNVTDSTLSGNEARGGKSTRGATLPGSGGGIFNAGTLTLVNSTVNNNAAVGQGNPEDSAAGSFGGGLDNSGTANVSGCVFDGNRVQAGSSQGFVGPADGGGINNRASATLTLTNSTVSGNTATAGSGVRTSALAQGGGIKNLSTLSVTNSTVSGNTATGGSAVFLNGAGGEGGGVYSVGALTMTNSTVSGNEARGGWGASDQAGGKGSGGGVLAEGTLTLTNCTVTLNAAAGGRGQTSSAEGGGLLFRGSGTAKPLNTIIAANSVRGNSAAGGGNNAASGPDVAGTFASQGHNLVGEHDGATSSFPAGAPNAFGDIVGTIVSPVAPVLGPLAHNGGPTETHRPWPGSPAVEGGDNAVLSPPFNLSNDQRGMGFPRLFDSKVDIGAVEARTSEINFDLVVAPSVGEGAGGFDVAVSRTGGLDAGDISVDFSATDGTASSRTDFAAVFGTLRFASGETSKTFTVFVTDDVFVEGDETVSLKLADPTGGAALGTVAASTLIIHDNDPSTPSSNPVDGSQFFVRQHYVDFLNREPDAPGLAFWTGEIESCGADLQCREVKRVNVSAAFFLSIESQQTGFFALRVRRAAFGKRSASAAARVTLAEYLRDARQLGEGVIVGDGAWQQRLEQDKTNYLRRLVESAAYRALYPETQTPGQNVDALFASAGVTPTAAERNAALNSYGWGGTGGRAAALRSVAESTSVTNAETNPAFVLSEYFGYLRRNPTDTPGSDDSGYQFWLAKLNQFDGDFVRAEMVKAFISAFEYRQRFGPQ